jgi:hypothetical protein
MIVLPVVTLCSDQMSPFLSPWSKLFLFTAVVIICVGNWSWSMYHYCVVQSSQTTIITSKNNNNTILTSKNGSDTSRTATSTRSTTSSFFLLKDIIYSPQAKERIRRVRFDDNQTTLHIIPRKEKDGIGSSTKDNFMPALTRPTNRWSNSSTDVQFRVPARDYVRPKQLQQQQQNTTIQLGQTSLNLIRLQAACSSITKGKTIPTSLVKTLAMETTITQPLEIPIMTTRTFNKETLTSPAEPERTSIEKVSSMQEEEEPSNPVKTPCFERVDNSIDDPQVRTPTIIYDDGEESTLQEPVATELPTMSTSYYEEIITTQESNTPTPSYDEECSLQEEPPKPTGTPTPTTSSNQESGTPTPSYAEESSLQEPALTPTPSYDEESLQQEPAATPSPSYEYKFGQESAEPTPTNPDNSFLGPPSPTPYKDSSIQERAPSLTLSDEDSSSSLDFAQPNSPEDEMVHHENDAISIKSPNKAAIEHASIGTQGGVHTYDDVRVASDDSMENVQYGVEHGCHSDKKLVSREHITLENVSSAIPANMETNEDDGFIPMELLQLVGPEFRQDSDAMSLEQITTEDVCLEIQPSNEMEANTKADDVIPCSMVQLMPKAFLAAQTVDVVATTEGEAKADYLDSEGAHGRVASPKNTCPSIAPLDSCPSDEWVCGEYVSSSSGLLSLIPLEQGSVLLLESQFSDDESIVVESQPSDQTPGFEEWSHCENERPDDRTVGFDKTNHTPLQVADETRKPTTTTELIDISSAFDVDDEIVAQSTFTTRQNCSIPMRPTTRNNI